MKMALVPQFHGTNCDAETLSWLSGNLEVEARFLDLERDAGLPPSEVACVVVPGGFSYGDYLRAGAIAARGAKMAMVKRLATAGVPVLGICNGFQILCEAGLLPGVLLRNANRQHNHFPVRLTADFRALASAPQGAQPVWLPRMDGPYGAGFLARYANFSLPMSCGMGNYMPPRELADASEAARGNQRLVDDHETRLRVLFRYIQNENGAFDSIAGIASADGRIVGLMPHPERASDSLVGGVQGLFMLLGLAENAGLRIRLGSALAAFARELAASAAAMSSVDAQVGAAGAQESARADRTTQGGAAR